MKHYFFKYQGTGNDFILLDDRQNSFPDRDKALIAKLCDRRFGIGSDGIILIKKSDKADFWIDFLNPDASRSFCGNGSRCGVRFAKLLGMMPENHCSFQALDGIHEAWLKEDTVKISMKDVKKLEEHELGMFLDTGSPHLIVKRAEGLDKMDVEKEGSAIRFNETYKKHGVNVNFVSMIDKNHIAIRTFERGVDGETLACGTGVTAAALALAAEQGLEAGEIQVKARGGDLSVCFEKDGKGFNAITLEGRAEEVFCGEMAYE